MARMSPRRILVVDDDTAVRTQLTWQLEAEGFVVECAADGHAALARLAEAAPDLMVLDLSMPGVAGLDVLRRVRSGALAGLADLPVIILTGRDGETDRIVGLDLGADDYLVKPFSPGELAARARSVLRRALRPGSVPDAAPSQRPGVVVDEPTREVSVDGREVELTAKEFDLVSFLCRHPRIVFTRAQLLKSVWDSDGWQSEATVTEHVHRLRTKLEADPAHPRWLKTVRGVGYRWDAS